MLFSTTFVQAKKGKLLDKVLAVVNDRVITLSMVKRIQSTVKQRRLMAPAIFEKESYSEKEVLEIIINTFLIREGLKEIGYIINDDQVESSINTRQKSLGVTREELVTQLKSFNISFDEYFELIRGSIESNVFNDRIISPLISITDQEVKNAFFEKYSKTKSLSFKYKLINFTIPKMFVSNKEIKTLKQNLISYRSNGVLPDHLKEMETNPIDNITEDGLAKNLKSELQKTNEGEFSNPVLISDTYHVFYVEKKDLVESEQFIKEKAKLKFELSKKAATKVKSLWFTRESNRHFIKTL